MRFIKQIIRNNCKENKYVESFSQEVQEEILKNSDKVAEIVLEDDSVIENLNEAIEEAVRISILRN